MMKIRLWNGRMEDIPSKKEIREKINKLLKEYENDAKEYIKEELEKKGHDVKEVDVLFDLYDAVGYAEPTHWACMEVYAVVDGKEINLDKELGTNLWTDEGFYGIVAMELGGMDYDEYIKKADWLEDKIENWFINLPKDVQASIELEIMYNYLEYDAEVFTEILTDMAITDIEYEL